jgi:hypothetical protein
MFDRLYAQNSLKLIASILTCFFQSGQMFCFLVPGQGTATVLANIFIGLNNAYSGFIASPALLTRNIFFDVQYRFVPGHYVYQGMVTSMFDQDTTRYVTVPETSSFYSALGCAADSSDTCTVTVSEYFDVYFDGQWSGSADIKNLGILILWSVSVRIVASIALKYLKYSGK